MVSDRSSLLEAVKIVPAAILVAAVIWGFSALALPKGPKDPAA
jgi:hypothetical protein